MFYISRVCSVRYRYSRYRYGCRTGLTEVSGTGIDVVPNLPKGPERYWRCTEVVAVSGTGTGVCTGTAGTGIDVIPNLPNFPVPDLMY